MTVPSGLLRFARNDGSVIARSVSDEAIQKRHCSLDCFASLAMTEVPILATSSLTWLFDDELASTARRGRASRQGLVRAVAGAAA
jgi:hypothetical protein